MQINSPLNTLLLYKLDVNASNVSLFPKIYADDAVGIGDTNNEFLIPYFTMSFFKEFQSYNLASIPHKSNYNLPSLAGDPLKVLYGPSFLANSIDA